MNLIDQCVLLDEQVLRHLTPALGVGAVVVGVDVLFVGERRLVGEHLVIGRLTNRREVADQIAVAVARGPLERVGVEEPVSFTLTDHLARPDERMKELRAFLHGEHARGGPPRLTEHIDPVLSEPVPQSVRDRNGVVDESVEGDRARRVELGVGGS